MMIGFMAVWSVGDGDGDAHLIRALILIVVPAVFTLAYSLAKDPRGSW